MSAAENGSLFDDAREVAHEIVGIVGLLDWPDDKPIPVYLRQIAILRLRALESDARGIPGAAEQYRAEAKAISAAEKERRRG